MNKQPTARTTLTIATILALAACTAEAGTEGPIGEMKQSTSSADLAAKVKQLVDSLAQEYRAESTLLGKKQRWFQARDLDCAAWPQGATDAAGIVDTQAKLPWMNRGRTPKQHWAKFKSAKEDRPELGGLSSKCGEVVDILGQLEPLELETVLVIVANFWNGGQRDDRGRKHEARVGADQIEENQRGAQTKLYKKLLCGLSDLMTLPPLESGLCD